MAQTAIDKKGRMNGRMNGILYCVLRVSAILSACGLFLPAINPARVSGLINKNMSLFTSGISYSSLIADSKLAIRRGWVDENSFRIVLVASLIAIIGILLISAAGCMSLGNVRFKRLSFWFSAGGSVLSLAGFIGLFIAYGQFGESVNLDRAQPMIPTGLIGYIIIMALVLAISILTRLSLPVMEKGTPFSMESKFKLFLMLFPFIVLCFVFAYLPLWGWRYAFFDYKAGGELSMENFVGFKWFKEFLASPARRSEIVRVLRNTLVMSGLGIATSWVAMAFAVFLSEIKSMRYRRIIQTLTTVPNFISWVLVYAIAFVIFNTDGLINSFLSTTGIAEVSTNYLMSGSGTWLKMLVWGMWKGTGWGAIVYIAAISGIDQQMYEAATVDGAGRFHRMWYITVPGLIPTYCVLLLMSIAGILSNGMEQYLVFKNALNANTIEVLDLYVYNLGIGNGRIPLSTVVGMVKSVVSVVLLFTANKISKLLRGESII